MDNYKEIKKVGMGSFGSVYKAVRLSDGLTVALKKVPKLSKSKREIINLQTECEIQKNLNHPNIIQMLDSFETNEFVGIVTEYAGAGDLSKLLMYNPQGLSIEQVRQIACDLVSALKYLHTKRILHRDMKPQNVLIGSDGSYKLCDFGFAKAMDKETYVLTSVKGTPLYMAPEIIDGNPYDHNTDLWSLGCILYELLVGKPPLFNTCLFQLIRMMKTENIVFPPFLYGDCLSFLKGLLEKNSQQRLTWPHILNHPFIKNGLRVDHMLTEEFSLTKTLSPSQEFAKESQRRHLKSKLRGYPVYTSFDSKHPTVPTKPSKKPKPKYELKSTLDIVNKNTQDITKMAQNLKLTERGKSDEGDEKDFKGDFNSNGSSCETMSSTSSESDYEGDSDDSGTIVFSKVGSFEGEVVHWKSGAMFSIHNFGSEDSPVEKEEWISFLVTTMKEVAESPKDLCQKHQMTMVVIPLRNHLTDPEVVEKIAKLLSVPFTVEVEDEVNGDSNVTQGVGSLLQSTYLETKVLANLLFACRLIIARRTVGRASLELDQVVNILEDEDVNAIAQCLRVVCFLVCKDEEFLVQFCDSAGGLCLLPVLKLLLKLDSRKPQIANDVLIILLQLLRIIPSNLSIVEEVLLETEVSQDEFWRLLNHNDGNIKSNAIRILCYLSLNSELARERLIVNSDRVWRFLELSSSSPEHKVQNAVGFAIQNMKYLSPLVMTRKVTPVAVESFQSR